MADVFVSYSRRDSGFVSRLAESISAGGKEVWLDTEGIADGEVFPEAIKRAIEGSDAFLFVITPASVASIYCENEVEHAREMQKRIVPVLREPVPDSELPPEIRDRNWIPFTAELGLRLAGPAAGGAGSRPRACEGAYAVAGQGDGVGRRRARQELPACAARSWRPPKRGWRRVPRTQIRRRRSCSANTCWPAGMRRHAVSVCWSGPASRSR